MDGATDHKPAAANDQSALADFSSHLVDSFKYNLIQAPLTAIAQTSDHAFGTKLEDKWHIFDAPTAASTTAAKTGDFLGGMAAMGVQLGVFHRMLGAGAAANLETSTAYGVSTAGTALWKSAGTGALMGGLLTPVNANDDGEFWKQKELLGGLGAGMFTALTAGSVGLKSLERSTAFNEFAEKSMPALPKILANDVVANSLPGVPLGLVNADAHSLITTGHFASGEERWQSALNFTAGGAIMGGVNIAHEHFSPTSGIQGIRTPEQMKKLADSTVVANHPDRYAFVTDNPLNPDELIASGMAPKAWYDEAAVALRQAIEPSELAISDKKMIVSATQEFARSLQLLRDRPDPKPIMVIYGTARAKPGDFVYERARYLAGRAVQEGYDVMSGGAPGGVMDAVNRGAYEAGGTSIGVTIELPFENASVNNGWHTLTLPHRNFATRQWILKLVGKDGVLVGEEGGIGTQSEVFDAITHIQTKKIDPVPVYLVGSRFWKPFEQLQDALQRRGYISPADRNLYSITDSPDAIFTDLRARKAEAAAGQ
ncbi:MAG TPA: LOG family protein [Candidatus Obscuribacterales bacterium]